MNNSDFENLKNKSLSHQLIKAGRFIHEKGLVGARDAFHLPELKQLHLDLFPYIDFDGTSISTIAKRKGVSKQSVSKLVQEMVRMKLLSLQTDPEDSRSKLVFFNTSGPYSIQKGFEALITIDRLLIDHLGEKSYTTVLKRISDLIEFMQSDTRG